MPTILRGWQRSHTFESGPIAVLFHQGLTNRAGLPVGLRAGGGNTDRVKLCRAS